MYVMCRAEGSEGCCQAGGSATGPCLVVYSYVVFRGWRCVVVHGAPLGMGVQTLLGLGLACGLPPVCPALTTAVVAARALGLSSNASPWDDKLAGC
jgi:hypothetical protein